jgi:hypothetical protein
MKKSAKEKVPTYRKGPVRRYSKGRLEITRFQEANGKTVDYIEHVRDEEEGYFTVRIQFSDDTALNLDITTRPQVSAEYVKSAGGDDKCLKKYKGAYGWK